MVQSIDEALHPSMPRSVLDHVPHALTLPASSMGEAIQKAVVAVGPTPPGWSREPGEGSDILARETAIAAMADLITDERTAVPAGFGCPSCHGALFELPGEPAPRFRCRVGHAWTGDTLLDEQSTATEGALWMALRSLEEKVVLSRRMAGTARQRGSRLTAERYEATGSDVEQASQLIRRLIERMAPKLEGGP